MKTITINIIFFLNLSFNSIMVVRGWNLVTQSVQLNRLPHHERTSDLMTPPTCSDAADLSATDRCDSEKTDNVGAVNMKPLPSSESWNLYKKTTCSQNHTISPCVCTDTSKKMCSVSHYARKLLGNMSALFSKALSLSLHLFMTTAMNLFKVYQEDTVSEVKQGVHVQDQSIWGSGNSSDHQHIVIMENKPEVIDSALFLFERYHTRSTLLIYDHKMLHVLKGPEAAITRYSIVTLVGHGTVGNDGNTQLGGYKAEELAQVVAAMAKGKTHLRSLNLIGCELGKDPSFVKLLLEKLRSLKVETSLHLSSSKISVNSWGEIVTEHEGVWRTKDTSKRVIAQLDQRGDLLTRVENRQEGEAIPHYQGHALYIQTLEWPTHPQMFVPEDLRKKYTAIDCLEGLTWSLFFEEHEKRRAPDYIPQENRPNFTAVWLLDKEPDKSIQIKHLVTILDLAVEIRYNAREDAEFELYYVLNDYIYHVQRKTFLVFLVGKYIHANDLEDISNFRVTSRDQEKYYSLQELTQGLNPAEFNQFCRQTFQLRKCTQNCEKWGRYFMAAVFSASVRNFRTFSLFLMSVIACEVGRTKGSDDGLCTAFVGGEHPMASEDLWHENRRRGFYGCVLDQSKEIVKREEMVWLNEVVAKENSLFIRSKGMMSGVDHNQETEIDVFGKVKVMNKYVFSSYLEFFRGTPEGKKLVRGCVSSPQQQVHVEN